MVEIQVLSVRGQLDWEEWPVETRKVLCAKAANGNRNPAGLLPADAVALPAVLVPHQKVVQDKARETAVSPVPLVAVVHTVPVTALLNISSRSAFD